MTKPLSPAQIRLLARQAAERTAAAQGLSPRISDNAVLRRLATLLRTSGNDSSVTDGFIEDISA